MHVLYPEQGTLISKVGFKVQKALAKKLLQHFLIPRAKRSGYGGPSFSTFRLLLDSAILRICQSVQVSYTVEPYPFRKMAPSPFVEEGSIVRNESRTRFAGETWNFLICRPTII